MFHPPQKIQNAAELARTEARRHALEIAEAGLAAIDTETVIHNLIRADKDALTIGTERIAWNDVGRVIVAGVGKCAFQAGRALERILGDRIARGVLIGLFNPPPLKHITALQGTHPAPSETNVKAAGALTDALKQLQKNDLVLFVVSGGGSTLLCLPHDRACDEEGTILKALTVAGATIQETNTVRKHLSLARGGYAAKYAYPARMVSLIFSDVPGDDMQFIASGPTIKDTTTMEDAAAILAKYDVLRSCSITECGLVETPKDEKYFSSVTNVLAVSNATALSAMAARASGLGFHASIRTSCLEGEAKKAARDIMNDLHAADPQSVLLYGGETTVTVKGAGHGGRNLELALAALPLVRTDELLMTVASDGRDNGDFAGAISDVLTHQALLDANLNHGVTALENNDEYPLYEKMGNYLLTGDTGSNVSDLIIALKT